MGLQTMATNFVCRQPRLETAPAARQKQRSRLSPPRGIRARNINGISPLFAAATGPPAQSPKPDAATAATTPPASAHTQPPAPAAGGTARSNQGAAAQNGGTTATGTAGSPDGIQAIASAITYWIPNETIAVYVVVVSAIGTNGLKDSGSCVAYNAPHFWDVQGWLWLVLIACAIGSPIIVYYLAKNGTTNGKKQFKPPLIDMFGSLVAFVAWTNYLPNSIIAHCFQLNAVGGWGPLVVAQVVLFVIGIASGRTPLSPAVTEAEREGNITLVNNGPGGSDDDEDDERGTDTDDGTGSSIGPRIPVSHGTQPNIVPTFMPAQLLPIFMGSAWSASAKASSDRSEFFNFLNTYVAGDTFQALSVYGVKGVKVLPWVPMDTPTPESPCTQAQLTSQIATVLDSQADLTNIMVIVFNPSNYNVSSSGQTTCTDNCGYHDVFAYNRQWVPFSVVAHADSMCRPCMVTRPTYPDALLSSMVHELCEMMTNPMPAAGGGWITEESNPREIADDCQGPISETIGGHNVQQIWIEGQGCMAPPIT